MAQTIITTTNIANIIKGGQGFLYLPLNSFLEEVILLYAIKKIFISSLLKFEVPLNRKTQPPHQPL